MKEASNWSLCHISWYKTAAMCLQKTPRLAKSGHEHDGMASQHPKVTVYCSFPRPCTSNRPSLVAETTLAETSWHDLNDLAIAARNIGGLSVRMLGVSGGGSRHSDDALILVFWYLQSNDTIKYKALLRIKECTSQGLENITGLLYPRFNKGVYWISLVRLSVPLWNWTNQLYK